MLNIKVIGSKVKNYGCWIGIEQDDDNGGYITIAGSKNTTIEKVCEIAAIRLRDLADKIDLITKEKNPFDRGTIKKINKRKKIKT